MTDGAGGSKPDQEVPRNPWLPPPDLPNRVVEARMWGYFLLAPVLIYLTLCLVLLVADASGRPSEHHCRRAADAGAGDLVWDWTPPGLNCTGQAILGIDENTYTTSRPVFHRGRWVMPPLLLLSSALIATPNVYRARKARATTRLGR